MAISQSLPYNVIEQSLIDKGIDGRTAAAAVRNAQKIIFDSEFAGKVEYYTTYLAMVRSLYDRLQAAGELSAAHKVLQDHKETYFLLNSILE